MARTITHVDDDETKPALFGERDHLEFSQKVSFSRMIFEVLVEREPSEQEVQLLDLILNLCVDHGPHSPSAEATISAAKEGKTMGESVGAGMAQIGDRHGGAGGPLMEIMYKVKGEGESVKEVIEDLLKEGKRLPGMGHRVYKDKDPRAELIMGKAVELGVGKEFVDIARQLRDELEAQSGKSLPVNIDGAIAAVFCGFGLKPEVGIAIFIVARAPGLCAHYINNS